MPPELKQIQGKGWTLAYLPQYEHLFTGSWSRQTREIPLAGRTSQWVRRVTSQNPNGAKNRLVVKASRAESAEKEFENYLIYQALDGVRSLKPIGFLKDANGKGYLYTELEQNAIPIRNLNLKDMPLKDRVKLLERCARGLGKLHNQGITHNDAELKNVLYTQDRPSELIFMDVVKSNKTRGKPSERAVAYDLLTMLGSSAYHGLVKSPLELRQFIGYYLKTRTGKPVKTRLERETENRAWADKLRAELDNHPQNKNIQQARKLL